MSEQRDPHTAEPEDLDVTAEEAHDVKGGDAVVSPRDPASGLPTGKRSPGQINFTHSYDKSSP
jgi:hypothetical protein